MTGQIKYKKSAFLFDALSFIAFIGTIALTLLMILSKANWKYAVIAGIAFIVFKLTAKLLMRRKTYSGNARIDPSVSMFDNSNDLTMYAEPMDDPFAPAKPKRAQKKAKNNNITSTETRSSKPATPPPEATEKKPVPVLKEVVTEPRPKAEPAKPKKAKPVAEPEPALTTTQPRQRRPHVYQFYCHLLSRDKAEEAGAVNVDDSDIICTIDDKTLSLKLHDPFGEEVALADIKTSNIKNVEYEELRDERTRKQKLGGFMAGGLLLGLFFCIGLIVDDYNATGKWKEWAWYITNALPLLAVFPFLGLVIAILIPFKKVTIYALFHIRVKKGHSIKFVTLARKFKRVKRILHKSGFEPTPV
jgi:hypothetical protein